MYLIIVVTGYDDDESSHVHINPSMSNEGSI